MKIHSKPTAGNVLFATLLTTGILSVALGGYLSLVRSENQFTSRSQTWNSAIPVAEAGIEEAMTQIKATYPTLSTANGWNLTNGVYIKQNNVTADEYYVTIIFPPGSPNEPTPVIVSQGFARVPGQTNYISRIVRVNTKLNGPPMRGMVVMTTADLGGNQLSIDSFNSTNSAFSTNGRYDQAKRGDKALLASLSTKNSSISLGNADIWGKVGTTRTGIEPKLGPNSSVGNKTWHDGKNTGIQPGALIDDINIVVEKPTAPYVSGTLPPTETAGVSVLGDGKYAVDNLSGTVLVTGKAQLLVTKSFNVSSLVISNATGDASLELYVAAPTVDISKGFNVYGRASTFKYFGLPANPDLGWPGNQSLVAGGNGEFTAMVNAPDTVMTLKGGGNTVQDFSGACIVKSIEMKGHYNFHFDESIVNEMADGYIAISWDEIRIPWETIVAKGLSTKDLAALELAAN